MRPGLPATTMRRAWSCSSMSSRRPSWGTARVSSSGCSTSMEHRNATPVAIIAAGLPASPTATEAATFGERSRFVELGLLSEVTVAEAIRVAAEHHHVTWADETIFAAIQLAAGYPHKVQLIGDAAWEVARPLREARSLSVTRGWPRRTSRTA